MENFLEKACNRIQIIYNCIYNHISKHRKLYFSIAILLTFVILAVWIYVTPYEAYDDYSFMTNFATGERLKSISEIIPSQNFYYMHHSGRIIPHGLLQLSLLLGKEFIAIMESAVYIMIAFLIAKIASRDNKGNPMIVILSLVLMYYFSPTWDGLVLWITGYHVYVLTILFMLVFIYLFMLDARGWHEKKIFNNIFVLSFMGLIVGLCNENMSAALLVTCFGLMLWMKKKGVLKAKHITAFVFLLIGTYILLAAPGNAQRVADTSHYTNIGSLYNIAVRIWTYFRMFSESAFPSVTMLIISLCLVPKDRFKKSFSIFFIVLAFFACGAMVAAPQGFVTRTYNPILALVLISIYMDFDNCDWFHKKSKMVNSLICYSYICFTLISSFYMIFAVLHI